MSVYERDPSTGNLNKIAGSTNSDISVIADSWIKNHPYTVGNIRVYNKLLYKCIQAHTSTVLITPEDTNYWELTNIGGEVELTETNLKSLITKFITLDLLHTVTTTYDAPNHGTVEPNQAFTIPENKYNQYSLFYVTVKCFNSAIEEEAGWIWKHKDLWIRYNEFYVDAPSSYYTQISMKCPANSRFWLYTRSAKNRANTVINVYGVI